MTDASGGSSEQLCRYYVNGVCRQGDRCTFSHDRTSRSDNVCKFYLAGTCNYGKQCRYDHIKPKRDESKRSSTTSSLAQPVRTSNRMPKPVSLRDFEPSFNVNAPVFVPSWIKKDEDVGPNYARAAGAIRSAPVLPLCPYFEMGDCSKGESCSFVHGILCEYCLKACLHPHDQAQQTRHIQECMAGHEIACETAFAEQRSAEKECGICLEKIWEKNLRFGILENCTHCFCLSCIRDWRKSQDFENNVIRSCPECRVHSNFVVPSVIWVEEGEEKKILVDAYRENTGKKSCKYYQLGRTGEGCPFGNKCFYKHQLPDGTVDPGESPRARRKPLLAEFLFRDDQSGDELFDERDDEAFLELVMRRLLR